MKRDSSKKQNGHNGYKWIGETILVVSDFKEAIANGVKYFAPVDIKGYVYNLGIYEDAKGNKYTFKPRVKMQLENGEWQKTNEVVCDIFGVLHVQNVHKALKPITFSLNETKNLFGIEI